MRRNFGASLILIYLAIGPRTVSLGAGIGDLIPDDAKVVVTVHNLKAAAEHIKAFATSIGVPIPPGFDEAALVGMSGLGDVWAVDQSAALVVMQPHQQGVALVIPVADAKAALVKLGGKGDDAVEMVNFPPGEKSFGLAKDKHIVLAPIAETLAPFKAPEETLGDDFSKDASEADIYQFVNIDALRPFIEQGLGQLENQLGNLPANALGPNAELTGAMLKWYVAGLGKLIKQTDGVYVALNVSNQRVTLEITVEFAEKSYCAKHLGNLGKSKDPLKGIGQGPFMFAMGCEASGIKQVMLDFTAAMFEIPELAKSFKPQQKVTAVESVRALYEHFSGFGMTMGIGEGGMTMAGTYHSENPEKLRDAVRESFAANFAFLTGLAPEIGVKMSRRTIQEIEVDEFQIDLSKAPEDQKKLLEFLYGKDAKVQMGIVGGALRFAMGGKDPILNFKGDRKELNDDQGVQAILEDLSDNPAAVVLIDPLRYAQGMLKLMANAPFLFPLPSLDLPAQMPPPVGIAIHGEDGELTTEIVIRADTVRGIVSTIKKALPQ